MNKKQRDAAREFATGWLLEFGDSPVEIWGESAWYRPAIDKLHYDKDMSELLGKNPLLIEVELDGRSGWKLSPFAWELINETE